eukprot:scaffold877_cov57-Attheya_sp.AAC.3
MSVICLSDWYTLEGWHPHLEHLTPEDPDGLNPHTSMIRGFLWVSECYDLVGDKERNLCAWSAL